MQIDTTYNRESVKTAKGHMARTAESLLDRYPGALEVVVYRRGGDTAPVIPGPTQIVYVAATGGKWGKSKDIRMGSAVGPSTAAIATQERERARPFRTLAANLRYAAAASCLAGRGLLDELVAAVNTGSQRAVETVAGDALEEVFGDRQGVSIIAAVGRCVRDGRLDKIAFVGWRRD